MSNAPYLLERARTGYRMGNGKLVDSMIKDGLWDPYKDTHMGNCAELCVGEVRVHARGAGRLRARVLPARAGAPRRPASSPRRSCPSRCRRRRATPIKVDTDEEPFAAPLEKMRDAEARVPEGRHGHRGQLLEDQRRRRGARRRLGGEGGGEAAAKPLARIVAYAGVAQAPEWFTTAPVGAIQKLLEEDRPLGRRHRPLGDQRGVRGGGDGRDPGALASIPRRSTCAAARWRSATRSARPARAS